MLTICDHKIVKFSSYCDHMVYIYVYRIGKADNIVHNIVTICWQYRHNDDNIVIMRWQYCELFGIWWTILLTYCDNIVANMRRLVMYMINIWHNQHLGTSICLNPLNKNQVIFGNYEINTHNWLSTMICITCNLLKSSRNLVCKRLIIIHSIDWYV